MFDAQRILIFDANWLGDAVMSLPFIHNVRKNFPRAFIAVALPQRCREIMEGCPDLNEIIFFDERLTHRTILKKIHFVIMLRRCKFDTVFLIHRSATRALLCFLAGIKKRIGYSRKKSNWLLNYRIAALPRYKMHLVDYYLGLLEGAGLKIFSRRYNFFLNDAQRLQAKEKLKVAGLNDKTAYVVFHPGANEAIRRWPEDNFVAVMRYVFNTYGLQAVVTGSPADAALGKTIIQSADFKIINLCGQTSLKELAAILEKAVFFVSGDTGAMHIACAVGTFTIALFGTASPVITGPRGDGKFIILQKDVGCSIPCFKLDCPDNRCMKAITVLDVTAQIDNFMQSKRP